MQTTRPTCGAQGAPRQFFHGGPAGRQRGAFLLPPAITGSRSLSEYGAAGVHRRDRVYVTIEFAAAMLYASAHPKGRVYVVEPIGSIEPDPDCNQPGLSFQCEKARILRIIKPRPCDTKVARSALLEYSPAVDL